MREPGAAGLLVGRTDVVPEVDRNHRHTRVAAQDHIEAIRQRVFLERDARDVVRSRRLAVALLADTAGQPSHRGDENNEKAQIGFVQHDVCPGSRSAASVLACFQRRRCETRPQVPTGNGSIRPPRLPDFRQALGRRQRAKLIRSLDGFDDAEVPDGQHIRAMQAEHQEHLSRPAPDSLHARSTPQSPHRRSVTRVFRDPATRRGFGRRDRGRTSPSAG